MWDDFTSWLGSLWGGEDIPANAIGQNLDGSYILNNSSDSTDLANSLLGKIGDSKADPSWWGPAIQAGGGLVQSYMGTSQAKQNNELAIQQANAMRDWLAQQNAQKLKAESDAAKLQAETAQKIAKMNNLANLYQTWGHLNQAAGQAMGQSAIDTGRTASGAIASRVAAIR